MERDARRTPRLLDRVPTDNHEELQLTRLLTFVFANWETQQLNDVLADTYTLIILLNPKAFVNTQAFHKMGYLSTPRASTLMET